MKKNSRMPRICGRMRAARMSDLHTAVLIVLILLPVLSACGAEERKLDEQIEIGIGEETFSVEVARTEEERRKGLMHRSSLGENEGMLFVFQRDQHLSFWMKDTEIPLSLAYISADGAIREIHDLEPFSKRPVESAHAVRYALELKRGAYERAGAERGDAVRFPEGWD